MTYSVKEIYYTLQGEGAHTGRPAIFCRFAGCNLWTGREEDRLNSVCRFCDTDFTGTNGPGGGKFTNPESLASNISKLWPGEEHRFVVLTGGEPMLQVDGPLVRALKSVGFTVAIETNGTCPVPHGIDWVCVSPKAGAKLVVTSGDELKLVFPQLGLHPSEFERMDFRHFYLQPMDGPLLAKNTQQAIDYCKDNPIWNLSIQTHKILNIA